MSDIERKIISLEVALHEPAVRGDRKKLAELLHKDFREVGYSGKTYDRAAILNDLPKNNSEASSIWSQDYEFSHLNIAVIQLHYLSAHLKNGELTRHARRTSIWVMQGAAWLLKYHQGTPTNSFKKKQA